ncbi:hypothetical protein NF556_15940 [Ornithinimicrobium faecis]|uniref:Uncharacterized protein n=1 Tax=Ornithinimicrobium faecis TaxID=2934158 RepID=A0ABY4YQW6_9MICO|nr:hypothetical protein [Ornithinimicrobium sp. HY1793]USQ79094.1 hypothetical protein NF556_15940 [Ornithinimicrobium sp. HY1793]
MAGELDDVLTVGAAAELLGVSAAQVQHLGRTAQVAYLARGLLDGASVRRYRSERQGMSTRAWAGNTAWAAIALLSGESADWLGQAQLSRLRSRLRSISTTGLVAATRNRARAVRFTGHESASGRLASDPRVARLRGLDGLVGLLGGAHVEGYIAAGDKTALVRELGLRPAVRGNFVLHEISEDQHGAEGAVAWVRELMDGPVLPALHAAVSEEPRAQGLARATLQEQLDGFGADG